MWQAICKTNISLIYQSNSKTTVSTLLAHLVFLREKDGVYFLAHPVKSRKQKCLCKSTAQQSVHIDQQHTSH